MRFIHIKAEREIEVPRVPNFLLYSGGKISIAEISDVELQYVAQAWTEALMERAVELRAQYRKETDD